MRNYKYIDKESPKAMTVGLFEFLNLDDAVEAIDEMTMSLYNKKLGAKNFGELVYKDETSPQCYTEVISCIKCGSNDICKNGKDRKGVQRYKCHCCGHTFSATSHTLSSNTDQNPGKWMSFIIGLLNCETCEELSKKCGISVPTAHRWRLKVFAALEYLADDVKLSDVIFADDTRIPYNFKGNHSIEFLAPRKAHKRGHQNTRKNVNKNTICVLCAIDSSDRAFSHCIGFGNPSGKRLSNGFKNKLNVTEHTVLVTDGAQSFKKVVDDYKIPRWERKITVTKKGRKFPNMHGVFHIQKINSYHSRLKEFLSKFKSVASRYLPGYLLLFDYTQNNKSLSDEEMAKNILNAMVQSQHDMTFEMLERKYMIPISNGPETELWEIKIPRKEQKIYRDWYNKIPVKEICEKHKISRSKIYSIKEKVEKYGVHDKIMNPIKKKYVAPQLPPLTKREWDIFLKCYRDGKTYVSVGHEYGISKQMVHKIIKKVLRYPESTTVKKYKRPKHKPTVKANHEQIYKDFKLMKTEDVNHESVYEILASKYGLQKRSVKSIILELRANDKNATFLYHHSKEYKTLPPQEYYDFLEKRDKRIYEQYLTFKTDNSDISDVQIFEMLLNDYDLSVHTIARIVYDAKKGIYRTITPYKSKIQANYNQKILMQQEHSQAQEQTDEAC